MEKPTESLAQARASVEALRDKARRLAEPYIAAGKEPGASEMDQVQGEFAAQILANADMAADYRPPVDARTFVAGILKEVFGRPTAAAEPCRDMVETELEGYAARAWADACGKTEMIGRPLEPAELDDACAAKN